MQFYEKMMSFYQKLNQLFIATSNTYAREFESYINKKPITNHADLEYWQKQFDNTMRRRGLQ